MREALKRTRVSRRDLAITLIGEDATPAQITSKKNQLVKWLRGDGIGDENARKLAEAFTSLGHPHTERAFFKDPNAPLSWEEEVAALWKAQQRTEREVLRGQREILEELRRLRTGS